MRNDIWKGSKLGCANLVALKVSMDLKTIFLSCGLIWSYVDLGGPAKLEI